MNSREDRRPCAKCDAPRSEHRWDPVLSAHAVEASRVHKGCSGYRATEPEAWENIVCDNVCLVGKIMGNDHDKNLTMRLPSKRPLMTRGEALVLAAWLVAAAGEPDPNKKQDSAFEDVLKAVRANLEGL